ncbi:MAG: ECF transporter S component [Thermocladium sp.]|jgi:riboflavin transporter FmnP
MAINVKKSLRRSPLRLSLLAVLSAVAVSLELLRIEFPFPLAPFLKYDLVGVPLLLLAMISGNRDALLGATVTAVAVFIATGDPIGASMKWLAEVATFIPFTIIYGKNRVRASLAIVAATASRTLVMDLANLLVTPYWLMFFAHACSAYLECLKTVEVLIPVISIFNASLALIYIAITVPLYEYMAKYLGSQLWGLR